LSPEGGKKTRNLDADPNGNNDHAVGVAFRRPAGDQGQALIVRTIDPAGVIQAYFQLLVALREDHCVRHSVGELPAAGIQQDQVARFKIFETPEDLAEDVVMSVEYGVAHLAEGGGIGVPAGGKFIRSQPLDVIQLVAFDHAHPGQLDRGIQADLLDHDAVGDEAIRDQQGRIRGGLGGVRLSLPRQKFGGSFGQGGLQSGSATMDRRLHHRRKPGLNIFRRVFDQRVELWVRRVGGHDGGGNEAIHSAGDDRQAEENE
jgi:hypothetical protein